MKTIPIYQYYLLRYFHRHIGVFHIAEHEEKMKQKRTQLNYQDVTPCHDEVVNKWRSLLGKVKSAADPDHKVIPKVDLWALVKDGTFMFIISVGFLIILWLLCVKIGRASCRERV